MSKTTMIQVDGGGRERATCRSAAEWATEVAAWKLSGDTSREYCRTRGISASTLRGWSGRRGAKAGGPAADTTSSLRQSTDGGTRGQRRGFLPVRVVTSAEDAPRVEAEVVLAGGRRVRIAGALTLEQFARLLDVVEGGGLC